MRLSAVLVLRLCQRWMRLRDCSINFASTPANRGVKIKYQKSKLIIELHIIVNYGTNISAIVKSIIHKVRYVVEEATGISVARVNVFVDSMTVK